LTFQGPLVSIVSPSAVTSQSATAAGAGIKAQAATMQNRNDLATGTLIVTSKNSVLARSLT
jgi:hypothetical protein